MGTRKNRIGNLPVEPTRGAVAERVRIDRVLRTVCEEYNVVYAYAKGDMGKITKEHKIVQEARDEFCKRAYIQGYSCVTIADFLGIKRTAVFLAVQRALIEKQI